MMNTGKRQTLFRNGWRRYGFFAALLLLLLVAAVATPGDARAAEDPFRQSSVRASLVIGSGTAFDKNYTIIGAGGGYFVSDGTEVGFDVESWQGPSPRITRLSPGVRYVFKTDETIRPYVGAFYRWTLIEGFTNLNAVGMRAGLFFMSGRGAYFGAGVVYDQYLSCDRTVYSSCSETYPELLFAITF